jgi:cytochrome c peroxidase
MRTFSFRLITAAIVCCVALAFSVTSPSAQSGSVLVTPAVPMELPIEVEIELSPAGSLKQAAIWPELYRLLKNPYAFTCPADSPATLENESFYCTATIQRRPRFGAPGAQLPGLNIFSPGYNFLTGQPMRTRTSDGEVSWDQPGPLFDPAQIVAVDAFNTPTQLRTVIGHLVACPNVDNPATLVVETYQAASVPAAFCNGKPAGSLVVYNPANHPAIPPNGTVVAEAAFVNGVLYDDGAPVDAAEGLDAPVNEEDFFRDPADTSGVASPLRPFVGRRGAEILGKALFWDMQVGSDGVQACGSCHFHAGVDNRSKGQLNSNTLGGTSAKNLTLEFRLPNADVVGTDFPFHKGAQDDASGNDSDDVMSSLGVSRFKQFNDIPAIGIANFLPPANGIRGLAPDIGTVLPDPVAVNHGLRRIEPRNTPTMMGAAFNFDNFWDGRARFSYNGGSVFGPSDPTAHIFIGSGNSIVGATIGHLRPGEDPEIAEQPVRIKFSSLASQSNGPPLSDFEMSFAGRNWPKIGKKLLQGQPGVGLLGAAPQVGNSAVVPLANQLVAVDDSRLGLFSNQGGTMCGALGRPVAVGRPGLCISYGDLIRLAFRDDLWRTNGRHLNGAPCGFDPLTGGDPFDGYCLTVANGAAQQANTNQFTQAEANFSLFFGLSVQAYEQLLIPDDTPVDQFFDANPNAGHGVGEPGDQAVLFPTLIRDLVDDGQFGSAGADVTLVPGFGADELFGFDVFAGANLTAALAPSHAVGTSGRNRNPQITNSLGQTIRVGSNPFTRSAKCMLCHLGPEQTDHSINISHGLLKNDAEYEYPIPPAVPDPTTTPTTTFTNGLLPAPEPSGSSRTVVGLILAEEVSEGVAQDAVEVEPRNFMFADDPATPWDDRIVAQQTNFAFGDQGVYNIGVRPIADDPGRGGLDPWGWPLSLAALTLKNIGGRAFEPCDGPSLNSTRNGSACVMANVDPFNLEATFEETGDGAAFPGTSHTLQSVNPGFERDPIEPQMPEYMIPWIHSLPAGELHPQIDEVAGMVPNTVSAPNGGPGIEFFEILFGADGHCAAYDPAIYGFGPPNFGYGPPNSSARVCPQNQSGVAANLAFPSQGTWPVPNRVMRDGAFKAPPLRNVELTGPFFHTGSFLTLRQVVDFYFEGGDFPRSNQESRDPHIVDLEMQAFAFGPSRGIFTGFDLLTPFDCSPGAPNDSAYPLLPGGCGANFSYLVGNFGDGLPDTAFLYDMYPDSDHPITPEPTFASRTEALEDAKNALVKFLIALTDPRVKFERAPFDKPEMFVPIDGRAPDNVAGRGAEGAVGGYTLIGQSNQPCTLPLPGGIPDGGNAGPVCFRRIPATGAGGLATALRPFLNVTSIPPGQPGFSCSAAAGPSHFCAVITP